MVDELIMIHKTEIDMNIPSNFPQICSECITIAQNILQIQRHFNAFQTRGGSVRGTMRAEKRDAKNTS